MASSTFKLTLVTACIAAVVTTGVLYALHRRTANEAAALRRENARLRLEAVQVHRSAQRASVALAVPNAKPVEPVSAPEAAGSHPAVNPMVNYRNEGQGSARAVLQTFAWACDQGDATTVAKLLLFDAAARAKAEAWFSAMPAEARSEWSTVDEMAASEMTLGGMARPFPAADVLERVVLDEVGADRMRLRLAGTSRDGMEFQRTPDGWKHVITESMVDAFIRRRAEGRR